MTEVLLSLGSNYQKQRSVALGLTLLQDSFPDIAFSQLYEFPPQGQSGPDFYNLAAKLSTQMPLTAVLKQLKQIEAEVGQTHWINGIKCKAFDIDMLTFGQHVTELPLRLPRQGFEHFDFVLRPLQDIAAADYHPVLQQRYSQLWQKIQQDSQFKIVNYFTS